MCTGGEWVVRRQFAGEISPLRKVAKSPLRNSGIVPSRGPGAVLCAVLCCLVLCHAALCNIVLSCPAVLICAALCCVPCCAVLYCFVPCCAVLYCAALRCTVLCRALLRFTVLTVLRRAVPCCVT